MMVYVCLKFSINNIFVNAYIKSKQSGIKPILFRTYGQQTGDQKSKWIKEDLKDFCYHFLNFLRTLYAKGPIIVIFRGFGNRFRKVNQKGGYRLTRRRRFIILRLRKSRIKVAGFIDESTISYNGCKSNKIRRRKLKHVRQFKYDSK